jgi:hypothetical protein
MMVLIAIERTWKRRAGTGKLYGLPRLGEPGWK